MSWKIFLLLFLLGITIFVAISAFLPFPGYMDAEYYYAGGLRLASGDGFSEPFLWNYLDDPTGVPHPSHAYWMPLASLLAALGMRISGLSSFSAARFPFLIVAAAVPPLTAALSYSFTSRRDLAIYSGILAALPVFYATFMATTDTFGIYMLLGGVFFLILKPGLFEKWAGVGLKKSGFECMRYFALGAIAGLMHLARADGLLWLGIGLLAVILDCMESFSPPYVRSISRAASFAALVILGYLVVIGPWFLRNLGVFSAPLAPGGMKALWLTSYNELYAFPASTLSFQHWWSSGLDKILWARLEAGGQNLLRAFAIQGEVVLGPFALAGLWRLRFDRRVLLGVAAWLLTFLVMTVIFPFQGSRGGYFHSCAALQPLLWAAAPVGFETWIGWGVRRRGWEQRQAKLFFSTGFLVLAFFVTVFMVSNRAVLPSLRDASQKNALPYAHLEQSLQAAGARPQDIVMVNNTPGYYLASNRPAISIPDGDVKTLLEAGKRYGARFVLLEFNHPVPLNDLYDKPGDRQGLDYLLTVGDAHIFRLDGEP